MGEGAKVIALMSSVYLLLAGLNLGLTRVDASRVHASRWPCVDRAPTMINENERWILSQ